LRIGDDVSLPAAPVVSHLIDGLTDKLQPSVSLAYLLHRLPSGGVANQQAQLLDPLEFVVHGIEAAEEEVPNGKLGPLAVSK